MKKKTKMQVIGIALASAYVGMEVLANAIKEKASIDDDNPYLAVSAMRSDLRRPETVYEKIIKPKLDSVLSFCGMIALLPVYAVTAAAVYLDDPGPVFFSQKRIGKDKHCFMLHKFRTMKMDTPHDVPTHLLEDPEQYITGVGRFIRKYSIDELPQLWDCFRQKISLIGPRPALWNQDDLIAEREQYGANDIRPGLTGWAQINGRDELEIADKAKLDGEYVSVLKAGGWKAFFMDVKCFFGTFMSVMRHEGVMEGGTGVAEREKELVVK